MTKRLRFFPGLAVLSVFALCWSGHLATLGRRFAWLDSSALPGAPVAIEPSLAVGTPSSRAGEQKGEDGADRRLNQTSHSRRKEIRFHSITWEAPMTRSIVSGLFALFLA